MEDKQRGWMAETTEWLSRWNVNQRIILKRPQEAVKRAYLEEVWNTEKMSTDMKFYAEHMNSRQVYERQEYLNGCMPPRLRTPLAKFRLRSHNLGMITDRWHPLQTVPTCVRCSLQEKDDETHMLLKCTWLNDLRSKYLKREVF